MDWRGKRVLITGASSGIGRALALELAGRGASLVLVNNAGISLRGLAGETDLAVDRRIMEVNYFGPIALTKALLPGMLARRQGHIVVVSSIVGHISTPMRSAYAASKHAVYGFFDALRAELHGSGIRVTLVLPGYIRTDISVHALGPDGQPYGRMDENQSSGLPVEACARQMADAIERGRAEAVISRPYERFGRWLGRHFPALFRIIVRRERPK